MQHLYQHFSTYPIHTSYVLLAEMLHATSLRTIAADISYWPATGTPAILFLNELSNNRNRPVFAVRQLIAPKRTDLISARIFPANGVRNSAEHFIFLRA